ncbi:hypothetical protein NE865_04121 [Phthorimaea operculella]|nr:hypothetical protein NE865_04121 [Phthorimaea operculella]
MDIDPSTETAAAAGPADIKESSHHVNQVTDMDTATISAEGIGAGDDTLTGHSSINTHENGSTSDLISQNTKDIDSTAHPIIQNTQDFMNPQNAEGIPNPPSSLTSNGEISSVGEAAEQESTKPNNNHDSQIIFKLPNVPIARKRPSVSTKEDTPGRSKVAKTSNKTDSESETDQEVNIFTKREGPQWYEVHENIQNISKTIVPTRLPAAFKLPAIGRPASNSNDDLEAFYEQNAKEYFKDLPEDAYDDAERSVSDCIDKIRSKLVAVPIVIPVAGMSNDDMMVMKPKPNLAPEDDLVINNMLRRRKETDQNHIFIKKMKYRGIRLMPLLKQDEKEEPDMLKPREDLLFHVRIYRPFTYSKQKAQFRGRHSVFARDLMLSGRHKLTDLRDSFLCPNDMDMRLDISERINDAPNTTAKDLFPSGFLFINNVFYVDKRNGCRDISSKIREWAAIKGIGKFPCRDMSKVTIQELQLQLGHPEVYVHQGNCEHLFTFSEIRLVNPNDPLNLSHYPCHTAISQNQTVYCTACADFGAKFIVTGCERVPFDPAFFCDTCLKYYLYNQSQKIDQNNAEIEETINLTDNDNTLALSTESGTNDDFIDVKLEELLETADFTAGDNTVTDLKTNLSKFNDSTDITIEKVVELLDSSDSTDGDHTVTDFKDDSIDTTVETVLESLVENTVSTENTQSTDPMSETTTDKTEMIDLSDIASTSQVTIIDPATVKELVDLYSNTLSTDKKHRCVLSVDTLVSPFKKFELTESVEKQEEQIIKKPPKQKRKKRTTKQMSKEPTKQEAIKKTKKKHMSSKSTEEQTIKPLDVESTTEK